MGRRELAFLVERILFQHGCHAHVVEGATPGLVAQLAAAGLISIFTGGPIENRGAFFCFDALPEDDERAAQQVLAALEDDLNTPLALSRIHELATRLNKAPSPSAKAEAKGALLAAADLLGLLHQQPEAWFRWLPEGGTALTDDGVESLIADRLAARRDKNWAAADRIRDQLTAAGVVLEDGAKGTSWRRA